MSSSSGSSFSFTLDIGIASQTEAANYTSHIEKAHELTEEILNTSLRTNLCLDPPPPPLPEGYEYPSDDDSEEGETMPYTEHKAAWTSLHTAINKYLTTVSKTTRINDCATALVDFRSAAIAFASYQFADRHENPVPGDPYFVAIDQDPVNNCLGFAFWPSALHVEVAKNYENYFTCGLDKKYAGEMPLSKLAHKPFTERVNDYNR